MASLFLEAAVEILLQQAQLKSYSNVNCCYTTRDVITGNYRYKPFFGVASHSKHMGGIILDFDGWGTKPAESLHVIPPAALDEPLPEQLHQPLLLAALHQLEKPKTHLTVTTLIDSISKKHNPKTIPCSFSQ